MFSDERRIAPRKVFSIPIRFRPLASEAASVSAGATIRAREGLTSSNVAGPTKSAGPTRVLDMHEGETVNLSERGICFKTAQQVRVGQSVELYFTLPRELTGRSAEPVRCNARVVHVDQRADERGWTGVGAAVERFEPLKRFRTWDN
ncbi:MAG: PilZ domain-containing protein [Candidatus Acidiferrales bacterium]